MGGRKFIFGVIVIVATTILVALGKLGFEQFQGMLEFVFAVYVTGNVVQKFSQK